MSVVRREWPIAVVIVMALLTVGALVGVGVAGRPGHPVPTARGKADLSATAAPSTTSPASASQSAPSWTSETEADADTDADSKSVVVAIGDSIMDGHGLKPTRAWPELIGQATNWQLTDLASDGTGFTAVGDDGDTFQDEAVEAVALHPSIVIIAASSNDLGEDPTEVSDDVTATMSYLRDSLPDAQIIAFNAFWGADSPPPELAALDSDLEYASTVTGAHYLDIGQPLAGRPQLMQFDGVHPTARGLVVLAAAIAAAIREDTAAST
jgi:acyl-CoA thioesterase-1